MWQGAFVLEHARQVSAIDPPAAGRAPNEMLGLVQACRRACQCISRAGGSCLHRPERKVDLVAHRGNVGLVKEELGSVAPAIAVLGLLLREGQHVVGCIANRA
jgi:hypothetical protein